MRKIVFIIIYGLLLPKQAKAQDTDFKISKEYITNFLITNCDGKTKLEMYKKTIDWISINFKNPKEVIQTQIENEMIRIEGFTENFNGTSNASYLIEISFKDGKYKFDPISFTIINGLNRFDFFLTYPTYFKSDGTLKERLKDTVKGVSDLINSLNKSLAMYIIEGKGLNKKDEW